MMKNNLALGRARTEDLTLYKLPPCPLDHLNSISASQLCCCEQDNLQTFIVGWVFLTHNITSPECPGQVMNGLLLQASGFELKTSRYVGERATVRSRKFALFEWY